MARCKHCGVEIREFNYGLGSEWLHIETKGEVAPGQPYKICKPAPVAEPDALTVEQGLRAARMLGFKPRQEDINDDPA